MLTKSVLKNHIAKLESIENELSEFFKELLTEEAKDTIDACLLEIIMDADLEKDILRLRETNSALKPLAKLIRDTIQLTVNMQQLIDKVEP